MLGGVPSGSSIQPEYTRDTDYIGVTVANVLGMFLEFYVVPILIRLSRIRFGSVPCY